MTQCSSIIFKTPRNTDCENILNFADHVDKYSRVILLTALKLADDLALFTANFKKKKKKKKGKKKKGKKKKKKKKNKKK